MICRPSKTGMPNLARSSEQRSVFVGKEVSVGERGVLEIDPF